MNLYLAGMIGSGKSTIGALLGDRLGLSLLDLDREMDAKLGYSFHRLVAEQGWLAFRELEYSICKDFAAQRGAIVCLGGGTVRYEWNRDAIRGTGPVILLEAREETLVERVSAADRPRVTPGTDLAADIRAMWRTYADRYRGAADYIYRTDEKPLGEEIDELERIIRREPLFSGLVRPRAT
ncbi:MAG: shikimate kinase [Spirochaetota bacterium]